MYTLLSGDLAMTMGEASPVAGVLFSSPQTFVVFIVTNQKLTKVVFYSQPTCALASNEAFLRRFAHCF